MSPGYEERRPRQDAAPPINHQADSTVSDALAAAVLGIATVATCWPQADGSCAYHRGHCDKPGKRPLRSKYDATTDEQRIRRRHQAFPLAGLKYVFSDNVIALDVDARAGGLETTTRWVLQHGPLAPTPADTNGHDGGGHYLLRQPGSFEGVLTLAPGVEAFGCGSELVMPPSPHYLGGRRVWRPGYSLQDVPIAEAPAWLISIIEHAIEINARPPSRGKPLTPAQLAEFEHSMSALGVESRGRAKGLYRCPFHDDSAPSFSVNFRLGKFNCHAASCDARGSLGTLRRLTGVAR